MMPEFKKILYATDLGPHTRPVFRLAVSLAQRYGGQITMLHALEPLGSFGKVLLETYLPSEAAQKIHDEGLEKVRAKMRDRLAKFCEEELGCKPEDCSLVSDVIVVDGPAPHAIIDEAAARGIDLIVMGTHSHSAIGDLLLGSTAHRVTQMSRIPVLVVPTGSRQR